jgi:gamma-glutamylcyclotransferase (GGCT)/AIG2-like uncharacterized protein YtfP
MLCAISLAWYYVYKTRKEITHNQQLLLEAKTDNAGMIIDEFDRSHNPYTNNRNKNIGNYGNTDKRRLPAFDLKIDETELAELNSRREEFDLALGHCAPIYQISAELNNKRRVLFVYGTLKLNFHWCHKFMSRGGKLISDQARTVQKYALIMGDSNVPYVFDYSFAEEEQNSNSNSNSNNSSNGNGHQIKGEIWTVDYETLRGLDEYEGISKGHYKRKAIQVYDDNDNQDQRSRIVDADIYMKAVFDAELLKSKEMMNEYSYEYHKQFYSPIKHIQVKQLAYLKENFNLT